MGMQTTGRHLPTELVCRILVLCLSSLLAFLPVAAEKEIFVPVNDVAFTISPERKSYLVGEPITIHYTIKNISNGALYAPKSAWSAKCPSPPHLFAWSEDSSGKHDLGGWGGSCATGAKVDTITERMTKEAVLLKPGESEEGTLRLEINGSQPGEYRIEASLGGWDEPSFSEAELLELERGALLHPLLRGTIPASTQVTLASAR